MHRVAAVWRTRRAAPAVLAAGALAIGPAARADGASFRAGAPLRASTDARLACLGASADGGLVWWRDRRRTIRADALRAQDGPTALGAARSCPVGRTAPDGVAVLAVPDADERGLGFALRPPGGRFSAWATVVPPSGAWIEDGWPFAFGGQVIAMGARTGEAGSAARSPAVLLRAADGGVRVLALPTGSKRVTEDTEVLGTVTGLDRAGRGLVLYGVDGELLAARFDGSGVLGDPQVLAPGGVDRFAPATVAVAPDGTAAAAWIAGRRATVVTGSTERGLDLSTATIAPADSSVVVAPDGGAVALGARFGSERVLIATRAPGTPFAPVRSYPADGQLEGPWVAIGDGRYLVAFGGEHPSSLARLRAVTGRLGAPPGRALRVPTASAVLEGAAAVLPPEGPATILTLSRRSTLCPGCISRHERREIATYRYSARPQRTPTGIRIAVAARQRLDAARTLRVAITCPRACAVRIVGGPAGSLDPDSGLDDSRTLQRGATTLRVVFVKPPVRAFRARLRIAVDDATGELRTQRTIVVEP